MGKKLRSILMAFVMIITLLPSAAFALDNEVWICISYPGDLLVNDISGVGYENYGTRGHLIAQAEGNISFTVKPKMEDFDLKGIKVYSGFFTDSLDNVNYSTLEGEFEADSSGAVAISLDLKKDKAYCISSEVVNGESGIFVSYSGDASVSVKSEVPYQNDAKRGLLRVKEEGTTDFDVMCTVKNWRLKGVRIYSATLKDSLDNVELLAPGDFNHSELN